MRNKHVTRFGNPNTRGGALYYVNDLEGLCQMVVDLELFRLHKYGVAISSLHKSQINQNVRFERDIYNSKVAQQGVPEKLSTLFRITKKSEAKKFCKNLSFSEFELFLLIQNCYQIGFTHMSKFPEYVPDHLNITDDDRASLRNGKPMPISKKMGPLLIERRHINVHLFHRESVWHSFYFSFEDIESKEDNHWKHGCHLHYVSYLWPNYTRKQVWRSFDTRTTKISGNLHIRFAPYEYPELNEPKDYAAPLLVESPGAFAFDPSLTSDCGSFPIPAAHIATRGCWITNVSTRD